MGEELGTWMKPRLPPTALSPPPEFKGPAAAQPGPPWLGPYLSNFDFLFFYLGKHSQELPKNLGGLVINCFLPKLLVTYGNYHALSTMAWWGNDDL